MEATFAGMLMGFVGKVPAFQQDGFDSLEQPEHILFPTSVWRLAQPERLSSFMTQERLKIIVENPRAAG